MRVRFVQRKTRTPDTAAPDTPPVVETCMAGLLAHGSSRPTCLPGSKASSDISDWQLAIYSCGDSVGITPDFPLSFIPSKQDEEPCGMHQNCNEQLMSIFQRKLRQGVPNDGGSALPVIS